ncbi:MAG: glycosyltransferase family 25 protein [Gammaproteobacteria bacterium]
MKSMKVFVISLLRSEARRAHVDRQLKAQNVDYQFFDALDGHAGYKIGFDSFDATQFILRTGRLATPGEIGCFASHRELWNHCMELDEPLLIMEDDFDLTAEFPSAVTEARALVDRYGYLRLQTESRGKRVKHSQAGKFSVHFYTKVPHGAAAYCISPKVARAFHLSSAILNAPVDVFIKSVWEHRQPLFGLLPYTVQPNWMARHSTIGKRNKVRKDLPLRSARVVEKARDLTRRALFNRGAFPRL